VGDTLTRPWTVVVHFWNASARYCQVSHSLQPLSTLGRSGMGIAPLTRPAVVSSRRLYSLTFTTPSLPARSAIDSAAFAFTKGLPARWDMPWIYGACAIITDPYAGNKDIEFQSLMLAQWRGLGV
jgi:hypothetical protein